MVNIVTRAGKGSALTNNELDSNFNNLNTGKAEKNGSASEAFNAGAATSPSHAVPLAQLYDGWITDTNAWTYASASTFTVAGNKTGLYVPGLLLKWTDSGGVKYGVVLSSAFGAVTTVTIMVNTDYVIANSAITSNSFSFSDKPVGFPARFLFSVTVEAQSPGATPPTWSSTSGAYSISGRKVFFDLFAKVNQANTGTVAIKFSNLPISVATGQLSGSARENDVIGISGSVFSLTNAILVQTYSGGNPIVNGYAWSVQSHTFF